MFNIHAKRHSRRGISTFVASILSLPATLAAQSSIAPDIAEPGSIEKISAATTSPQFLSPWVSYVPASTTVPSPSAFLGRIAGAEGELVDSAAAYAYGRAIEKTSRRVRVFTIGRSEEGREILMFAIADEAGIASLDDLKAATAALADPRTTDEASAEEIIAKARPFYYFNAGLHSDETGSTESMLELAYRLAVSEQPMIRRIRENVVVLINPVSNPDGRDRQVQWFYEYLKGKKDLKSLPRMSPPYWSNYAFVDINRDAHQQVHGATKAVNNMFHDWHPTIVHDLHESIALLMTWNGSGPYNPNIDPISYTEFQALSFHEVQALTSMGMPGVSTWDFGEGFSYLYLDSVAMNHNAIGRGYETFGNGTAETLEQTLNESETSRKWWRVSPPPSGTFKWSARDNVNYNQTAALAALDMTALQAKTLLRNFYRKGYNSWRKGRDEAPYAFIIPPDQGDPARVAQMVSRLMDQRIEVHRATATLNVREGSYPVGSYVVRLDQPYRNYAVDLLTKQDFPKQEGEPYDDVSWSFPAHYHLDVAATADASIREAALERQATPPAARGNVNGAGPVYLLKDSGQESLMEARYLLSKFRVLVANQAFTANGQAYPAGSWILPAQQGLAASLRVAAVQTGLQFTSVAQIPEVQSQPAKAPRLGVWVPWADTDTIGWLRYSLDQRHIPYTYVRDEDVRTGRLRDKYDVLLYGHVDLELAEQIHGLPKKWGPMPYLKTRRTPAFGTPASSDDITGGIGWRGLEELQKFVEGGGLLVTLGSGTMLALEGGIVRGVRRDSGGVPRSAAGGGVASASAAQDSFARTPGSHIRVSFVQPEHPIGYGYAARTHVFRQNFPLYATPRRWLRMAYCSTCLDGPADATGVVMEWGDREGAPTLVSGQVWGEKQLVGRPAILDMKVGQGSVVSFNFNPLHRDLNRGDQRLLWNAILNWEAILERGE